MCIEDRHRSRSFCHCLSSDLYLFSNSTSQSMANKFRTKREDPDHRGCQSHITDTYLSFLNTEYSHFLPWICPGHCSSYCSCWNTTETYDKGSVATAVTDTIMVAPGYPWVVGPRDHRDHQMQPSGGQCESPAW